MIKTYIYTYKVKSIVVYIHMNVIIYNKIKIFFREKKYKVNHTFLFRERKEENTF